MRILCLLTLTLLTACAHKTKKICDHIELREGQLSIGRNEEVLVCGSDKGGEGWKRVPLPQAQYQLSVYLNNDGYLNPRFERDKDQLHVWSGPRTEIKSFQVIGADAQLDPSKKRKIVGEPLEPARLDEVQQWAETGLRNRGHACPSVSVEAQAWDSKVIATAQPGPVQRIRSLRRIGFDVFDQEYLKRYEAFDIGDEYDAREMQLTAARMLSDGFIQSANFETVCDENHVDLTLRGSVGPPKLFRFEVGASTEQFPFGKVTFKNVRLDDKASSFTAILFGSPREQSLSASSQLYWLPGSTRTFLGPRAQVGRFNEDAYEYLEAKAGGDLGRFWDLWDIRFVGRVGPTVNYLETKQGVGPSNVSYLSWGGSLEAMSHNYESTLRTQFEGWTGAFRYRGQREGLGSEISVNRYDVAYKGLWNMGNYAPPLFVLGFRFDVNGVDADEALPGQNPDDLVPIDYRVFYGGADNLRGFARKSLSNNELGYLTGAYAGMELRLVGEVPYNIEPLLLYDVAQLGKRGMEFDDPVYTSAGVGVRWASPFGTLRGSAAKGEIHSGDASTAGYKQEWVYFVSFGQEF